MMRVEVMLQVQFASKGLRAERDGTDESALASVDLGGREGRERERERGEKEREGRRKKK